ncbi:MAG: TetR/AcrR family transcriptional regulator [Desulfuromonadaceae bacterium]|jgi:AcrR family transcriptional regulator|nr:TetR/AcrR family transcriptional regulator [Desulfuromonas sp.]MDY0184394.1 TetR/AcrR family transcriptional regulator [Desulfuromonadaceae bacterium]
MALPSTKKQSKRQALLEAALELFAEHGLTRASTAQIAKRAGVASGTLFFHFNSKEELIHALFDQVYLEIDIAMLHEVEPSMTIQEQMTRLLRNLLRYFLKHPDQFRFMEQFHFSSFNTLNRELHTEKGYLRALMLRAREQHIIKDAPCLSLEATAFGPIVALAKEHANRGTLIDERTFESTIEACWDALKR